MLNHEDYVQKYFAKAIHLLSRQAKSQSEIDRKLTGYLEKEEISSGEKENIIREVVARLKTDGLYDDESYSRSIILSAKNSSKPKNRRDIAGYLYRHGIPKELIDLCMQDYSVDEEQNACRHLLLKKLKNYPQNLTYQDKQKIINYLLAKGFSFEIIKNTFDSLNVVK